MASFHYNRTMHLWRILPFARKMFLSEKGMVLLCLFLGSVHTPCFAAKPVYILWKEMVL